MRNTSTAPNAIISKYELERSTAGVIARPQALHTSSKTNARVYHREIRNFSNYQPFGNDANFGNHPDAADVIIRYNRSRKITSSKYNIFATSPLSRSVSIRTSRCPTDKEGRGALEPPPEDFYVFHSFEPCRRQAKQTNAQALQTSSKANAREYATAKFKTLQ